MNELIFNTELKTGFELIDNQHQEYIRRLNLYLADTISGIMPESKFKEYLEFIISYAAEHFDAEEALMQHYKYPLMEKHIKAHDFFRERSNDFFEVGYSEVTVMETEKLFVNWFVNHIKSMDFELVDYLKLQKIIKESAD